MSHFDAKLIKCRPSYLELLRTFDERRIDWTEVGIHRAINIQPNFELELERVNSNIWSIIIVAWISHGQSLSKLKWVQKLLKRVKFEVIERNIDQLIESAIEKLKNVTEKDLK